VIVSEQSGLDGTNQDDTGDWLEGDSGRSDNGNRDGSSPVATKYSAISLINHAAVKKHGHGVSTDELVNFTDNLHDRMVYRVKGIGHRQYAGKIQAFETYTVDRMVEETLDELADVLAYVNMLTIKFLSAARSVG
jgi:hypothetical protein